MANNITVELNYSLEQLEDNIYQVSIKHKGRVVAKTLLLKTEDGRYKRIAEDESQERIFLYDECLRQINNN